ncbi:MAG: polysaccharide pyruvyl transferase family protein [Gaiellaceae bacterium]
MGDLSMLAIAVERLRALWPEARIGVIAGDPDLLGQHFETVTAVPSSGRRLWLEDPYLGLRLHERLPEAAARRLRAGEHSLRRRRPGLVRTAIRARRGLRGRGTAELDDFLQWVSDSDLLVVSGAGALTDPFAPYAMTVLDLLDAVTAKATPTAMFGQGVGPLTDPWLLERCRAVLPRVDLIALREDLAGRPILRSLGVAEERIVTTGDDAVELAFRARTEPPSGHGLGVSLRVARYANFHGPALRPVEDALRRAAAAFAAPLVPVPISHQPNEQDAEVIARLLPESDALPSAGLSAPLAVIEQVRRCRVVVTGSYHAAVFALAQGIPAVGLAASEYYVDKFLGLADQFGGGCVLVTADEPALLEQRLMLAIQEMWESADDLAPRLLEAAARQVAQGRAAYRRLPGLLAASRHEEEKPDARLTA